MCRDSRAAVCYSVDRDNQSVELFKLGKRSVYFVYSYFPSDKSVLKCSYFKISIIIILSTIHLYITIQISQSPFPFIHLDTLHILQPTFLSPMFSIKVLIDYLLFPWLKSAQNTLYINIPLSFILT